MSAPDLAPHAERIARALLGEPNGDLTTKRQLRFGSKGSLAVELVGQRAGRWYDHEQEVGGGLVELVRRERHCETREAFAWLRSMGIGDDQRTPRYTVTGRWVYRDRAGQPVYRVVRRDAPGRPKTIHQERYDPTTGAYTGAKGCMAGVRLVPYRLPEWLDADGVILVAEGEAKADALFELGYRATCNPGGAGKFSKGFSQYFADRDVLLFPDNDNAGRDHVRKIAEILQPVARSLKVVELPGLPPKGDIVDWRAAGGTVEELRRLIEAAPDIKGTRADHEVDAEAGATLLDEVEAFLSRFVAYPSRAALTAHILWCAHSHAMAAWESTPRIAFLSPEPASGKTRSLEAMAPLVPRPVEAINVTPAYLFRKVDAEEGAPTILFDEIDTVFGPKAKDNEEIRALLNAGHRKGATAGRCVVHGKQVMTEEIGCYCAVALAGLGWLPDTIMTRSILIRMRRRAPTEIVEAWRDRLHRPAGEAIGQRLAKWAAALRSPAASPDGRRCPTASRIGTPTCGNRCSLSPMSPAAAGRRGRAALRWSWSSRRAPPTVPASASACWPICAECSASGARCGPPTSWPRWLRSMMRPGATSRESRSIARALSKRLREYGVERREIRIGTRNSKGYARADLHDAWQRYLPSAEKSATSATSATTSPDPAETLESAVADKPESSATMSPTSATTRLSATTSATPNPAETLSFWPGVAGVADVADLRPNGAHRSAAPTAASRSTPPRPAIPRPAAASTCTTHVSMNGANHERPRTPGEAPRAGDVRRRARNARASPAAAEISRRWSADTAGAQKSQVSFRTAAPTHRGRPANAQRLVGVRQPGG